MAHLIASRGKGKNGSVPRRSFAGWFNLPCIRKDRKEPPVKIDCLYDFSYNLLDFSSDEELPDLPDFSSEEECPPVEYDLRSLTTEDLSRFTDEFSSDNLIATSYYDILCRSRIYRAKMTIDGVTKDVIVKIVFGDNLSQKFNIEKKAFDVVYDHLLLLEAELKFLSSPMIRRSPNLPKVIGCCRERCPNLPKVIGCCRDDKKVGLVYDLNTHKTLYDFIVRDDFKWLLRVKTALALSSFLCYLHDRRPPYMIRNFDPSHIMVDQNFTPILIEFSMLVGGILGNRVDGRIGDINYSDPAICRHGPAEWSVKSDVYSFGVLLLNLITKRVADNKTGKRRSNVEIWARGEYKPGCSFVHRSLADDPCFDPSDGPEITKLVMQCIAWKKEHRPNMRQVVKRLKALGVAQQLRSAFVLQSLADVPCFDPS